ncbi:MAG: DUF6714 family protein [Cyanobacteria bacterium P01_A01_bin.114]
MTPDELKAKIRAAFADVERPPHWCITDSNEGDEPASLRQEFAEVPDWASLSTTFLDQAPNGYGSALSFFSDEAFRYYLPAFVIADLDDALDRTDPVFHLTHGLGASATKRINPRRYGDRTFGDAARHRFSLFTPEQCAAIAAYLRYKADQDEFAASSIEPALASYWLQRTVTDR